ncbi:exocyst complex component EXO70A1-like [Fagus crenata]
MALNEEDPKLTQLELAYSDFKTLLQTSAKMEESLGKMDKKFDLIDETLSTASRRVIPLQSLAMATKALDTRINRAVTPALSLIEGFKLSESLQDKLIELSSNLSAETTPRKRLKTLLNYVDCVDQLNASINSISREGEPVIQKLQEVVEFLSRTKATDEYRTRRLRETLVNLKALYETEVDVMKFEGLLDEALLKLQDEYESLLLILRHQNIGELQVDKEAEIVASDLGTELEVEVLQRISETLAANDCLDICIEIFVKVRYRRAAKALMRLNPEYLRTYKPEEIDDMEWVNLETAITLWIQHLTLAVKTVLVSERKLCNQVLGNIFEGVVWPECFVKIADKIMAVFFRFNEGVARSSKEPHKLFKLLEMYDCLEKLKPEFSYTFEGEAGADIFTRFRELAKLLVHASTEVFWEFGLQIEGNSDAFPPPQDGSVPKFVRYAINYLKYLATDTYRAPMAMVLRTEQIWKVGILSKLETDEDLLKDAITNVMDALQRNIETNRSSYNDKMITYIFAMNTDWYIYMRTKNTELGKLLGEQYIKKKYKIVAEESAYMYQKQTWVPLVRLLDNNDLKRQGKEGLGLGSLLVRAKMEAFLKGFEEISQRHRGSYRFPDLDLRVQIKESTMKLVVPVYTEFLNTYSAMLRGKLYVSPDSRGNTRVAGSDFRRCGCDVTLKRRDSKGWIGGVNSVPVEGDIKDFLRSRSNASNV